MRGKFITIEGGEGVGKTTNITLIEECFKHHGVPCRLTREPGGTELGESVRELLLNVQRESLNPMAELLLMFAARAQHLALVIEPLLAEGQWIICDRFTDSTYAYQGGGRELGNEAVAILERLVQGELRPDLTIILDVAPQKGLQRAEQRGELDRFEQEQNHFFERVRAGYLERAKAEPERCHVIDASFPLADVQRDVRSLVERFLAQHWLP